MLSSFHEVHLKLFDLFVFYDSLCQWCSSLSCFRMLLRAAASLRSGFLLLPGAKIRVVASRQLATSDVLSSR